MNPLFLHRFELICKGVSRDVLLVFVATPLLDSEAFATMLEAEIEANLVPDEVMIIIRDPSFERTRDELATTSLHQATLARFAGRTSVTLAGYDATGEECRREIVAGPPSGYTVSFDEFRRRAMTAIFNQRRGFVEANATYHFENPSGHHSERFIRLSNILARGAEIAFIGFCAMPSVPLDASVAYLDTPSLYAVIAAINEQRSSFAETAIHILADNFSSYAGFSDYPFDIGDKSFVLISASSSGSLARRLVEEKGMAPERIAHLLYLGRRASDTRIICNLARDSEANPDGVPSPPVVANEDDCPMCARGSHAIKLQGDQFEFAGPQQDALLIVRSDAPQGLAELMERYVSGEIFELGLRRGTGRTARQFSINAERLVAHPAFRKRLDYVLRRSIPARLDAVIAVDADSVPLAQLIASHVAQSVPVIARDEIDTLGTGTEGAIVIAGVAIESGRTLLDISRDLRSIAPHSPLLYVTGFSKSTGEPRREALERSLVQTHNPFPYQFIAVERMVLPGSSADNAWANELKFLIDPDVDALVTDALRPVIAQRVARLRKAAQPLLDDLYLPNAEVPLRLQPGFVFWPDKVLGRNSHTQADVFFTIASVLQRLRANVHYPDRRAILSNWFQQTLLAPSNFGRFNDDCIQASLLRAAYPYELNFVDCPAESREMGRLVHRIVAACRTERGGAATEFLLALATGRLQICAGDLEAVLTAEHGNVPMVKFLQGACRAKLA